MDLHKKSMALEGWPEMLRGRGRVYLHTNASHSLCDL